MDSSNPGPLLGRFKAENAENILKAYRIVMDVKETGKSYILQLVEFESRYSASHISHLFSKSKRVVLRKAKGGHAIRKWGDGTFTFYPFQHFSRRFFFFQSSNRLFQVSKDCLICILTRQIFKWIGLFQFSIVIIRNHTKEIN